MTCLACSPHFHDNIAQQKHSQLKNKMSSTSQVLRGRTWTLRELPEMGSKWPMSPARRSRPSVPGPVASKIELRAGCAPVSGSTSTCTCRHDLGSCSPTVSFTASELCLAPYPQLLLSDLPQEDCPRKYHSKRMQHSWRMSGPTSELLAEPCCMAVEGPAASSLTSGILPISRRVPLGVDDPAPQPASPVL